MKHTKQILLVIFLCSTSFIFSQDLNKLLENNGFRKIKLNTNVNNYIDDKGYYDFIKNDSTNIEHFNGFTDYNYLYASNDYKKIGETDIKRIYVKTLNDIIYQIYLILDTNWEISVLTRLAYGKPTFDSSNKNGFDLVWHTQGKKRIGCFLIGFKDSYYFQLRYEDFDLRDKAWDIKSKERKKKAIKEF